MPCGHGGLWPNNRLDLALQLRSSLDHCSLLSWEACFCDGCAGRWGVYASHLSSPLNSVVQTM